MIRVFLADDHTVVRQGLKMLIEQCGDMRVVGEAGDGWRVLHAAQDDGQLFDVLVLDISLPQLNGLEVLRRLQAAGHPGRVVILSMFPAEQFAARLLSAGAAAYVSKDGPPEELLAAIRAAAKPAQVAAPTTAPLEAAKETDPHHSLSPREYEVFTLIIQGRTVSEIATELGLSASTASTHVHRIKSKLGVRSLGEIVTYAHRTGLVR